MSTKGDKRIVRAAGAVVHRTRPGGGPEILVIHRRRYADWTLPKGKLEGGESFVAAATREVLEETGVTIRLGTPLDIVRYPLESGLTKMIRYWSGEPVDVIKRDPDDEVDVVSWLPVNAALQRLSFDHDKNLVRQCVDQPSTCTLLIVRHGKAMERKDWSKKDTLRPLGARGRKQAQQLIPFLSAYGIKSLVTSTATRCVTTLQPYAGHAGIGIETHDTLTEEVGGADPDAVIRLVTKIQECVIGSGQPTALCVHRPVLPTILRALDLAPATLATGEMLVAHLAADEVHAIERHRPQA